ncbi:hypothetical protein CALCODRAFT_540155 [Calocera cornea HHB12733]|uniref:Uncharacterized protein n=1 Tax=Calocera cornea HHB12733 TaxID=1353952 RepID=A0A166MQB5_9BASI|nr:hypothetical protein CALCODRAFT_540155 [Calocera cornea HHB12733]
MPPQTLYTSDAGSVLLHVDWICRRQTGPILMGLTYSRLLIDVALPGQLQFTHIPRDAAIRSGSPVIDRGRRFPPQIGLHDRSPLWHIQGSMSPRQQLSGSLDDPGLGMTTASVYSQGTSREGASAVQFKSRGRNAKPSVVEITGSETSAVDTESTADSSDNGSSAAATTTRRLEPLALKTEKLQNDDIVNILEWAIAMRQYPSPSLLRGKSFGVIERHQFPPEFSTSVEDIQPVFESFKGGMPILTRGLGAWGPMKVAAYSDLGSQTFIQLPSANYDILYRYQDTQATFPEEDRRWRIMIHTVLRGDAVDQQDDDDDFATSRVRMDQILADRAIIYDVDALRGTNERARHRALHRLGFLQAED